MDEALKHKISSYFEDLRVDSPERHRATIVCRREIVLSLLSFLKSQGYNHLALISCVDWIKEGKLELVYVLSAYLTGGNADDGDREQTHIIVKTKISREDPLISSVMPVFINSEPYEREIHELFGVHFEGHPRLTPLFLERKYDIPPFRKDFDTRAYVKNLFDTVPFVDKEAGSR